MKIARDQEVRIRLTLDQKQKLRFYAALVGKSMSEVVVEALASLEVPDEYKKRKHAIYQGPE